MCLFVYLFQLYFPHRFKGICKHNEKYMKPIMEIYNKTKEEMKARESREEYVVISVIRQSIKHYLDTYTYICVLKPCCSRQKITSCNTFQTDLVTFVTYSLLHCCKLFFCASNFFQVCFCPAASFWKSLDVVSKEELSLLVCLPSVLF